MNWRLGALSLAVLITESSCRVSEQDPVLLAIEPNQAHVDRLPTPVHISGEGLQARVLVAVDNDRPVRVQSPMVRIGDVELQGVTLQSSEAITANVPKDLLPGVYDLEVTLGNGETAVLESAFEVLQGDSTETGTNSTPTTSTTTTGSSSTQSDPCVAGPFGEPERIWPTTEDFDFGPALTGDGSQLLFARENERGEQVLQLATRSSGSLLFDAPRPLDDLGSINSTPILSTDNLRIVFMSERSNGRDLWSAARTTQNATFENVRAIDALNTQASEARPWLSSNWLTIYFESDRHEATGYDIWQAKRLGPDDDFDPPEELTGINTAAHEGSPSFTSNSLHLFYLSESSPGSGIHTLFESRRAGSEQRFLAGVQVSSLAHIDIDDYAAVSPDGREVYYSRGKKLYRTVRQCE